MANEDASAEPISERSFRRAAGVAAVVSAPLAVASLLVALPAVNYDMATVTDLMLFLRTGARGAAAGRASMLFDMLGYYLLIAPATLVLGRSLEARAPLWVGLCTRCVLAYVLVGAAGAAILAAALPSLMTAYPTAATAERATIELVYRAVTDAVYGGLWNLLEELLAGVGWFGLGWFLRRAGRPRFGVFTMVLGAACLADGIGNMFGAHALAEPGLYVYLLLAPCWALWLGIGLLARRAPASAPR